MHTTPTTAGHFLRAAIRLLPDSESATPQRLILLGRLAHTLGATGDLRQARETMHEVLRLLPAELTQIRAQTARACATVEQISGATPRPGRCCTASGNASKVSTPTRRPSLVALVAGESVEREHGQDRVPEAIAAAREVGDPMLLATALSAATLIDGRADRLDEAAALLDALPDSDLVRDIDAAFWLSWSEVSADRLTAASRHMSRGLHLARASRQSHKIALLTAIRGMVHAYLGELAEATTCFDDSLESAELTGSEELRVMALTFGCWITTWRGDLTEAIRLGKEAIAVDDQATAMSSWRSGQAEAMLAQAMLHSGDPHACIELLLTRGGGAELPAVGLRTRPLVYLMLTEAEVAAGRVAAATDGPTERRTRPVGSSFRCVPPSHSRPARSLRGQRIRRQPHRSPSPLLPRSAGSGRPWRPGGRTCSRRRRSATAGRSTRPVHTSWLPAGCSPGVMRDCSCRRSRARSGA